MKAATTPMRARAARPADGDHQLVEGLIDRLPQRIQTPTRWLRRPSSRWIRIPTGVLLVGGGFLAVLPLFGLWMLPLGLLLLAEDMPPLRRARHRILDRLRRRRPHWFTAADGGTEASLDTATAPPSSSPPNPRS